MSERLSSPRISRRTLLRGGAAAALAAGLPLSSCSTARPSRTNATGTNPTGTNPGQPAAAGVPNVRVSDDRYGVHVEPSVAVNPRNPRHLLAACQVSPTANPEFIASYVSTDGGAHWRSGGLPRLPAGAAKTGDDVTVAFDAQGRGYVCATSYAGGRAIYVWRTGDGGHSFSAPVTLLSGQYCDHPWMTAGPGQAPAQRNVYAVWSAGASPPRGTGIGFTRSVDGGESFETPRMILGQSGLALSSGPAIAAGADGLVCAVCDWKTQPYPSGEIHSQVVAVCSADAGKSFGPPVPLGPEAPIISLPGHVLPDGSPAVAAHGHSLYAAFTRHRPGAAHSDIMVTASRDRGRTWSKAVPATPADGVIYFQPNLAVDAAGRVAVSAFALAHGLVNVVLLVSPPGKLRFGPPRTVTTTPFHPHSPTNPGKHGAWWIGDYQGIAAGAGAFHLVWNDTRTGKLDLFAATVRP